MISPPTSPSQEANNDSNEWAEYQDDDGRTYFFNEATQESAWELPPDAIVKKLDDATTVQVETETAEPADEEQQEEQADAEDVDVPMQDSEAEWAKYQDDDINEYDSEPSDVERDMHEDERVDDDKQPEEESENIDTTSVSPRNNNVEDEQGDEPAEPSVEEVELEQEPQSPPRDPKEIALENAQEALNKTDSVLEPNASNHLITLVTEKQNKGAQMAMQSLYSSFVGQTAICGVLSKWLLDLKTANENQSNTSTKAGTIEAFDPKKLHQANADSVRQLIEQVIAKTAKANFTDSAQQRIFNLSKKERQFFEEMMEHKRWRRLLIDLSAEHQGSALLTYCLQSISKRGHHREIAKRINQSDYFDVFHGMLTSEISLLGKTAVNGGKADELNDVNSVETIVNDLKRQCTCTAYTYIYVIEVSLITDVHIIHCLLSLYF